MGVEGLKYKVEGLGLRAEGCRFELFRFRV